MIIYKGDVILVTLPPYYLVRPHVEVDELTRLFGSMARAGFKGPTMHLGLNTHRAFLDIHLVHDRRTDLECREKFLQGAKTYVRQA
jgi:hypothetical protein